ALEMQNERGDTPLHLAASRGFARIYLVRDDGDSILHTAIRGEYFDLAVIIVHYYDFLSTHLNREESTPLKVLATKPSAFKSASNLSWYKRILYHCILVEPIDAERTMRSNLRKIKAPPDCAKMKFPENYTTLYDFVSIWLFTFLFATCTVQHTASHCANDSSRKEVSKKKQHDTEDPSDDNRGPFRSEKHRIGFLPPNYETFHQFVKSAYVHILGLSGVELKDVKIAKKKHLWSSQLLKALMKRPYAAFNGSGGQPTDMEIDPDIYNVFPLRKQGGTGRFEEEQESESDVIEETTLNPNERKKETKFKKEINKKMSPFLVAARNGIVEMVNEILIKIPSAIHDTNSRKENVLLVAVKYRQPLIVETLRSIIKNSKPGLWNILIHAVDEEENTVLHFAAEALYYDNPSQIGGAALQMMWDIKWFQ
ncbi:nuclear factor NF-kappa-B p105 subunit, partial [Trifolium medium]|nr:nuclear factor NF-kappa-B p105 subunit [Trifolium medium]